MYNITVRAYTRVGPGPSSKPVVVVMTLQDSESTIQQLLTKPSLLGVVVITSKCYKFYQYNRFMLMELFVKILHANVHLSILFMPQYLISFSFSLSVPGTPAPPNPPLNDTISPFGATLSWSPPPDANGVVLNYTVNLVALGFISSDGSVGNSRGKRQMESNQLDACAIGGADNIDRNITVDGETTSLVVNTLSE